MILGDQDDGVDLYFNNVKKFETASDGVVIAGDISGASTGAVAYDIFSDGAGMQFAVTSNHYVAMKANNVEKMRLTDGTIAHQFKGGKSAFAKGVTPAVIDSSNSFEFLFAGSSDAGMSIAATGNSNATGFLNFRRSTTTLIGHINRNGTSDAVNYNTSSDYRLKENIANITDGITRVKQLTPRRFSWKSDSDSTMQDGFIAHEIDSIVTHAVSGTKDAVKTLNKVVVNTEDDIIAFDIEEADWTSGKGTGEYPSDSTWVASKTQIIPQALDYSTVTPLLTAALKEAIAKIETLETKVQALEDA
jgi:hypothetical protein